MFPPAFVPLLPPSPHSTVPCYLGNGTELEAARTHLLAPRHESGALCPLLCEPSVSSFSFLACPGNLNPSTKPRCSAERQWRSHSFHQTKKETKEGKVSAVNTDPRTLTRFWVTKRSRWPTRTPSADRTHLFSFPKLHCAGTFPGRVGKSAVRAELTEHPSMIPGLSFSRRASSAPQRHNMRRMKG